MYQQNENRDAAIARFLPLVKRMAARLALGLPSHVDRDDLVGSGILGLLDALEKYNPAKGPQKNYVALRVQGAMLDNLRKMSWLPRSLIAKAKKIETANAFLQGKLKREPTIDELAGYLEVEKKEVNDILANLSRKSLLSLEEFLFDGEEGGKRVEDVVSATEEEAFPAETLIKKEEKEMLIRSIDNLTEREQLILHLYYREGLTLKEIGQVLEVTESRVSQLHGRVMLKLRQQLKEEW